MDPVGEREWLVEVLGFPWDGADAYWSGGAESNASESCAYRSSFTFLNNFTWHEIASSVAPSGALDVGKFYTYVHELHTTGAAQAAFSATYEWDAYAHLASAFYVPSVDPHALRLSRKGVPHVRRSYAGAAGETWYVLYVWNQFNGEAIALHGGTTAFPGEYPRLEDGACLAAVALPFAAARYQTWWTAAGGALGADGLPDPLPVLASQPTPNATDTAAWLEAVPGSLYGWNVRVTTASNCAVAEVAATVGDSDVVAPIRFVESTARTGDLSVGDYAHFVDVAVRAWTGSNEGYSRWLDNSVGLEGASAVGLSDIAAALVAYDVPWRAHATAASSGTVYAAGPAGLGLELRGNFSSLDGHALGGFDYCSASTTCRPEDASCAAIARAVRDGG